MRPPRRGNAARPEPSSLLPALLLLALGLAATAAPPPLLTAALAWTLGVSAAVLAGAALLARA